MMLLSNEIVMQMFTLFFFWSWLFQAVVSSLSLHLHALISLTLPSLWFYWTLTFLCKWTFEIGEITLFPFTLESSCISGTKLCLFHLSELQKCILYFSYIISFCTKVGVVWKPTYTHTHTQINMGTTYLKYMDSRLSIGICLLSSGHQSCSWLRRAWWAKSQKL